MMILPLTVFAFVAAFAAAYNITRECTSALIGIAFNQELNACLNPAGILAIITGNSSTSALPAFDRWVSNVCAGPMCSNATIDALVANLTAGCPNEVQALGEDGIQVNLTSLADSIKRVYPVMRQAMCFKMYVHGSTLPNPCLLAW